MLALFVFIFGLAIGSFLNVVLYRLAEKKSIVTPASFCPRCKKKINWYDNIPLLSFIILAGRCRHCQKLISWQYPLIELATGLIFVWLYFRFGLSFDFLKFSVFSSFLLVIFVYDLKYYLILDKITLPAMVIAFFASWYSGINPLNLLLAAVIGSGFFGLQYFVSSGRWVGGGDIRLGALMGLMLGWRLLLTALFIAYLAGAAVGIVMIISGKKKMSSALPFGAFLAPATFFTFLYGQKLFFWYLNLIRI